MFQLIHRFNTFTYCSKCIKSCLFSSYTNVERLKEAIKSGPELSDFISNSIDTSKPFVVARNNPIPYISENDLNGDGRKVYMKVYGCQMNVNDTQIASTILQNAGYELVNNMNKAEIVFLMTCSIRENAESKIWNKLHELKGLKKRGKISQIGVLGCMAERLKTQLLEKEKCVDVVAGPDTYRDLPRLLAINKLTGQNAVNVMLSLSETYENIMPTMTTSSMSAFVSIMRGCENMCSYCIVPFTRGRERSRPIESILDEVGSLSLAGIKEVTLLGQNVNSYRDLTKDNQSQTTLATGFKTIYKPKSGGLTFDILLDEVAKVDPEIRIRFTSPHPKDFPDQVLNVINKHNNIAKCIHLPAQSGNNNILQRMRRGYTREAYLDLVNRIREIIPGCALSSDFISGFCGETEEEHHETLDLIRRVRYNLIYMFHYSMREKTHAFHTMKDDVPLQVKIARLEQVSSLYREIALGLNKSLIGKTQLILIEGTSKRSENDLAGRNDANVKVIIPKASIPQIGAMNNSDLKPILVGDYVAVRITNCNSQTLLGEPLFHTSISNFHDNELND